MAGNVFSVRCLMFSLVLYFSIQGYLDHEQALLAALTHLFKRSLTELLAASEDSDAESSLHPIPMEAKQRSSSEEPEFHSAF